MRDFLKSDEMEAYAKKIAIKKSQKLGRGHRASSFKGFDRSHAVVRTTSKQAYAKNLKSNTMLKTMGESE